MLSCKHNMWWFHHANKTCNGQCWRYLTQLRAADSGIGKHTASPILTVIPDLIRDPPRFKVCDGGDECRTGGDAGREIKVHCHRNCCHRNCHSLRAAKTHIFSHRFAPLAGWRGSGKINPWGLTDFPTGGCFSEAFVLRSAIRPLPCSGGLDGFFDESRIAQSSAPHVRASHLSPHRNCGNLSEPASFASLEEN